MNTPLQNPAQADAVRTVAAVLDLHPQAAVVYDPSDTDAVLIYANQAFLSLTGYDAAELAQRSHSQIILPPPESQASGDDALDAGLALTMTVVRADGGFFRAHVDSYSALALPALGDLRIAVVQPSAYQAPAPDALTLLQARSQTALELTTEGVCITDRHYNILVFNAAAEALTGWSAAEAMGRPASEVITVIDSATRAALPGSTSVSGQGPLERSMRCVLLRRHGGEVPIELTASSVLGPDDQPAGSVLVLRDDSAATTLAAAITHQALHDSLTGLPNRQLFEDRVDRALSMAGRNQKPAALLLLNIDGYTAIAEHHGLATGEAFLKEIAVRLSSVFRRSDTVCRLDGDDFAVLLSEMARAEDATAVAHKILQAMAQPVRLKEREIAVSLSIGISVFPGDGKDSPTLLNNARSALQTAQQRGHNTFELHSAVLDA